ncbi:MAG: signal peptidase I, partial [Acidobacteriota bacterium]|nr:signal peptidase I [Acidobacteriota bacterium]
MEFRKSTIREYFESAVTVAIIALFATTFVVQAFKIPTGSMKSTLLIGDHLLVNKFVYGIKPGLLGKLLPYRTPKHGDIIVFKYPNDPDMAYVKRLIGMPGDTVEMIGRTVYVNGQELKENYSPKEIQYIGCDFFRYNRKDSEFFTTAIHGIDAVRYIAGAD